MGVVEPGVLRPPDGYAEALDGMEVSVGNALGSWILPTIQRWTSEMY